MRKFSQRRQSKLDNLLLPWFKASLLIFRLAMYSLRIPSASCKRDLFKIFLKNISLFSLKKPQSVINIIKLLPFLIRAKPSLLMCPSNSLLTRCTSDDVIIFAIVWIKRLNIWNCCWSIIERFSVPPKHVYVCWRALAYPCPTDIVTLDTPSDAIIKFVTESWNYAKCDFHSQKVWCIFTRPLVIGR